MFLGRLVIYALQDCKIPLELNSKTKLVYEVVYVIN